MTLVTSLTTDATLDAVAQDAAAAFGAERIERDAQTVRLNLDGAALTFAVGGASPKEIVCRAFVTALTRLDDPGTFCREALEANFFWSGTHGAALSVDSDATALYLSERLLSDQIAGPEAFADYVNGFVETLVDWRLRARSRQGGVDALPASADFSLHANERAPTEDASGAAVRENGMEVFR